MRGDLFFFDSIFISKYSVCEYPVDIEAREIEDTAYYGFDWIGSSNILIHDSNLTNTKTCGNSPTWSYGISKDFGLVILKRSIQIHRRR